MSKEQYNPNLFPASKNREQILTDIRNHLNSFSGSEHNVNSKEIRTQSDSWHCITVGKVNTDKTDWDCIILINSKIKKVSIDELYNSFDKEYKRLEKLTLDEEELEWIKRMKERSKLDSWHCMVEGKVNTDKKLNASTSINNIDWLLFLFNKIKSLHVE